ncbi:MAG: tRNA (guanosine(46)-N7)-methyltransferase TrmB [Rhodobacterales bacterium]|nr:tRNA (guanosine(46)-N7)-methyltransferase TrmB [Rhodobacterales bacterium]
MRSYGRRHGKPLRANRQALVDDLLPRLRVDPSAHAPGTLDPRALFDARPRRVWLEIGFGGGEHLAAQAAAHPDVGLIGCEPFMNGVAALLARVDEGGLTANLRLLDDDARRLLAALAPASLDRVFILFPDPWPKTRHHKRRLINPATLDALARVLADGAELRFASDHKAYMSWALERLTAHPAFAWTARRAADWRARPADGMATRYEEKALARGETCTYLTFRRRPRGG